jgi:hypothetical protein
VYKLFVIELITISETNETSISLVGPQIVLISGLELFIAIFGMSMVIPLVT